MHPRRSSHQLDLQARRGLRVSAQGSWGDLCPPTILAGYNVPIKVHYTIFPCGVAHASGLRGHELLVSTQNRRCFDHTPPAFSVFHVLLGSLLAVNTSPDLHWCTSVFASFLGGPVQSTIKKYVPGRPGTACFSQRQEMAPSNSAKLRERRCSSDCPQSYSAACQNAGIP